ncbi:hypothetical protein, partial [Devosia indica]
MAYRFIVIQQPQLQQYQSLTRLAVEVGRTGLSAALKNTAAKLERERFAASSVQLQPSARPHTPLGVEKACSEGR